MELIKSHRVLLSRFLIVGGIGFVANYAILKSLTDMHINSIVSEIVAAAVALQITFLLHDNWTYRTKQQKKHHYKLSTRYISYLTSNSFGSLMTVVLFSVFLLIMDHLEALLCAAIISMVWNFTINKTIVWKQKSTDSN